MGVNKGTVATIGVFATALGPVLMGGLLKAGVPFSVLVPGCASLLLLSYKPTHRPASTLLNTLLTKNSTGKST
ncbi:MAG: hypothetical protein IH614_12430 [Desulfuromonadales bacterium]|nr:hypothetical protein [Desulfuromonadales bacterium]